MLYRSVEVDVSGILHCRDDAHTVLISNGGGMCRGSECSLMLWKVDAIGILDCRDDAHTVLISNCGGLCKGYECSTVL